MPIALERRNGIGRSGFVRGRGCFPMYELPAGRKLDPTPSPEGSEISSCSSSIGKNSDRQSGLGGEDVGEAEVESAYRGALETMDALEESLPIRRGISNFYRGKSKSFTCLADVVSTSSSKDLVKPENAYTRKRRNLVALKMWERPHGNSLRSTGGGISKRPSNSNRRTLALAVSMCSTGGSSTTTTNGEEEHGRQWLLPPLHPPGKPAACASPFGTSPHQKCNIRAKSFSSTDLQGMDGSSSSIGHRDKRKGFD